MVVSGMETSAVGELAHHGSIMLHELATHRASLEQAFISATGATEEFVAHEVAEVLGEAPVTTTEGEEKA